MTLWQASLHTCQLVGDIYPLINAPMLIGISSSFFIFILFFFISSALSSSLNYFSQTGIYLFYLFGGCYWLFAFRSRHFKREGLKVFVILHVNRSDATLLLSKQAVKSFNVSSRWLPNKVWWVLLLLQSPKILSGVHSNNKSAVLQSGFFFCSFAIW